MTDNFEPKNEWKEHFGPLAEMREKQEKATEFVEKMKKGKETKKWREHFGPLAEIQEQEEKELKAKKETAGEVSKDIKKDKKEIKSKLSFFKKVEDKGLEKTIQITEALVKSIDDKTKGMFSDLAEGIVNWQEKTGFGWESKKVEAAAEQTLRKLAFIPALAGTGVFKGIEKIKEKVKENKLSPKEVKETKGKVTEKIETIAEKTAQTGEKAAEKAKDKFKLFSWIKEKVKPIFEKFRPKEEKQTHEEKFKEGLNKLDLTGREFEEPKPIGVPWAEKPKEKPVAPSGIGETKPSVGERGYKFEVHDGVEKNILDRTEKTSGLIAFLREKMKEMPVTTSRNEISDLKDDLAVIASKIEIMDTDLEYVKKGTLKPNKEVFDRRKEEITEMLNSHPEFGVFAEKTSELLDKMEKEYNK